MFNRVYCLYAFLRCFAVVAGLMTAQVWAQGVSVSGAWVRATVPGQTASGAYMDLNSMK